jgi:RNA methyltransferase, TrmH family
MIITSLSNPRVKAAAALAQKKHREAAGGLFLLEGEALVARAAEAGFEVVELWHSERQPAIPAVETMEVAPALIAKITGKDNPQEVVGVLRQRWAGLPQQLKGLWLALDRPRDPGNLGTIIRTADAVACSGLILIGEATDPYAPECVRATSGSIANVPLVRATEAEFVAWAKGREVLGTAGSATVDYRQAKVGADAVVLMGSESDGLTPGLLAACTQVVRIPMWGRTESLNLAVSVGVMLYGIAHSR